MQIEMKIHVQVTKEIEKADMVLVLGDYENFTKNKVYDIYLDKNENLVLYDDNYDCNTAPLDNIDNNILLSVSAHV